MRAVSVALFGVVAAILGGSAAQAQSAYEIDFTGTIASGQSLFLPLNDPGGFVQKDLTGEDFTVAVRYDGSRNFALPSGDHFTGPIYSSTITIDGATHSLFDPSGINFIFYQVPQPDLGVPPLYRISTQDQRDLGGEPPADASTDSFLHIEGAPPGLTADQGFETLPDFAGTLTGTFQYDFQLGSITHGFIFLDAGDGTLNITGQSIRAVPEPQTWALLILGFGGAGVALRRGRRMAVRGA